jgi:hypothetical protein
MGRRAQAELVVPHCFDIISRDARTVIAKIVIDGQYRRRRGLQSRVNHRHPPATSTNTLIACCISFIREV